ncbi:MAG: YbaB/EbfC family nucleoid-associated protein [Chloroflexi bacterium]|nr:YbaB/EbfC family nucleoid-associated protein [Chloroflexota bacterium]
MNKNMLRQAQQLQARLARIQEELESATVEATAGGGVVKAVVTGHLRVKSVEISTEVVNPEDVEMLQDLVTAAVNEGLEKAQQMAAQRMSAITGGLKIPGLM